jgi:large subunit ribosomal protein L5
MNQFELWLFYILKVDFFQKNFNKNFLQNNLNTIVISTTVNDLGQNKQLLLYTICVLKILTSQKPTLCKTKKAVSFFKIKKNMVIGAKVSLRKKSMYDFLNVFIHLTLPKINNFKKAKINSSGNVIFCVKDSTILTALGLNSLNFPDIKISVALVFNKQCESASKCLLSAFQIPYPSENKL